MKKRELFIILVALVLRVVFPTLAATWNVPGDSATIQGAIDDDLVSYGDTVQVAAGTYIENITLKNGVALIGSGASTTIIDGNDLDTVVTSFNCDQNTVLQGFTITNGNATYGGGMYNEYASPTVINCTFTDNTALYGGGMYNYSSDLTIVDCTFNRNFARGDVLDEPSGGGIENEFCNPIITGCIFTDNSAYIGGGMENYYSNPLVSNCTFTRNLAVYGGGMDNLSASPFVTDCTFTKNTAEGDPNSAGGGMSNSLEEGSTIITNPTVKRCIFIENSAAYGGGMDNGYRNPIVADCNFSDNTAFESGSGGGMYNFFSSPSVTACTFNYNSASFGGGISNEDSNSVVVNCTFIGNSADSGVGGGIENFSYCNSIITNCTFTRNTADYGGAMMNYYFSNPIVNNSILWSNSATSGGDNIYNDTSTEPPSDLVITYSDIQGGYSGEGNINSNPMFLADIPDQVRLLSGSPCIDSANGDVAPDTDILGNPRFDDPYIINTGVGILAYVDMGAYESDDPCLGRDKSDFNCDGIVNMEDFVDFASSWLK